MTEFFTNYPYVKWILIGFGVLALLSRYLKFDPIDKLIDRKRSYKFEETNHLEDPKLKSLIELLKQQNWSELASQFQAFQPSYRSFAFRTLGQYADDSKLNQWVSEEPQNDLPKVVKAYRLVHQGWEFRGRDTIDTVSENNLERFKNCLKEARGILTIIDNESSYKVNVNALLLKLYKALDTDRATIHQTFQEVESTHKSHAELNLSYFSAISPKWGGSSEEVNAYLDTLSERSEFINNLITAQYYFDYVHMMGGEDKDNKIKEFITSMKSASIDANELYKYELYLLLYWLSNNLEYTALEKHYQPLVRPYWKD